MHQVDLNEAKSQLPDLIEEAANGEEIIITKNDRPVAKIVSISQATSKRKPGSAKGMITISEDFDEPLEDFKEYM
jgi:prevent-host-death family protein